MSNLERSAAANAAMRAENLPTKPPPLPKEAKLAAIKAHEEKAEEQLFEKHKAEEEAAYQKKHPGILGKSNKDLRAEGLKMRQAEEATKQLREEARAEKGLEEKARAKELLKNIQETPAGMPPLPTKGIEKAA